MGQKNKFPYGLKIIYCTPRSITEGMMRKEMRHCIKLKIKYPDLICGMLYTYWTVIIADA
jgi:adenosine deaminase CECR1